MIILQRYLGAFLLVFLVFLGGCSWTRYFDAKLLTSVNFNNRFVEYVDEVTAAIEDSFEAYKKRVPAVISPDTVVTATELEAYLANLKKLAEKSKDLKKLKSRNQAQETAVHKGFEDYFKALNSYIESYEDVTLFYSGKEYKLRADLGRIFDDNLNQAYDSFSVAHSKFVLSVLAAFETK